MPATDNILPSAASRHRPGHRLSAQIQVQGVFSALIIIIFKSRFLTPARLPSFFHKSSYPERRNVTRFRGCQIDCNKKIYICNLYPIFSDFRIKSEEISVKLSVRNAQDIPGYCAVCEGKFGSIETELRVSWRGRRNISFQLSSSLFHWFWI